jgi:uncharacterized SAM-binding protein YcdF (DUF218 family)
MFVPPLVMGFIYSILLKLLSPTSLCLLSLLAAAVLRKRKIASRICFWMAVAILMVCGNGWLVDALTRNLEGRYRLPEPAPRADVILVLSGGLLDKVPPRRTVEVADAGDRVIYAARLYKQRKAGLVICTGGIATGGVAPRSGAEVMKEFLAMLDVPGEAVVTEGASGNTHQHAQNLPLIFQERKIKRVLLVTSAMHMPRSMGVFRKQYPGIEFIPAPTDFRVTDGIPRPWYHEITSLIPTPRHLLDFSDVMHEYLGMAYYKARGWM